MPMLVPGGSLLERAQDLLPQLYESTIYPREAVQVIADETAFQGWRMQPQSAVEDVLNRTYGSNESFILDFGDHHVGYVSFSVRAAGSPQDAPPRLKLVFGEMPCEMGEEFDSYNGWLSRSWLQDEVIVIDVLPQRIELPRRYTFRYMKVIVLSTSQKYKVQFADIQARAVTSGNLAEVKPLPAGLPADIAEMDRIGIRTLQNCMHTVFEDGPKRDRRLWLGDLRLQALANYYTFNNHDLVKRCLYLFAGMRTDQGQISACIFEQPEPHADDTFLFDYSLFFASTLYDYYNATKDKATTELLWPAAKDQIRLALERVDDRGIVRDDPQWWCFVDWHPELNKQASAQAVLIYCLKRARLLAQELSELELSSMLSMEIERLTQAALEYLWDENLGYFISGEDRNLSWASQIWMVLAEVPDKEDRAELLDRLFTDPPPVAPMTPYMVHHLIEALFEAGKKEKALDEMRKYWGEMIKDGADTFWEVYNPDDKKMSPYGSNLINSYCHAWSCTPTYFIRKYLI